MPFLEAVYYDLYSLQTEDLVPPSLDKYDPYDDCHDY